MKHREIIYRIFIPAILVHRVYAEFSTGRRAIAWGRISRSYHGTYCDLLVHGLRYADVVPSGSEWGPTEDWILLDGRPVNGNEENHFRERIRESQLRDGQLLCYLRFVAGSQQHWIAFTCESGRLKAVEALILVGGGLKVRSRTDVMPEIDVEDGPWSRLVGAMTHGVFSRLRDTPVMIVGAGRTGSLMASTLVRSGVTSLTLVDGDILEEHNRDMTVGNYPGDVGGYKVAALVRYLHSIRPDTMIRGIAKPVQHESVMQQLRRCPVVITCVDNDVARDFVSRQCARLLRVHLDIGTIVRRGDAPDDQDGTPLAEASSIREIATDVRLILPGACLQCIGGLNQAVPAEDRADDVDWRNGGRAGSLPSINHLAVGAAYQMLLDLYAGHIVRSCWQRLVWVRGRGVQADGDQLSGLRRCPVCGETRLRATIS